MKEFTLFWLTGKAEIVKGKTIEDACNKAGIGNGAIRALDFYSSGDKRKDYNWDSQKRSWVSIKIGE